METGVQLDVLGEVFVVATGFEIVGKLLQVAPHVLIERLDSLGDGVLLHEEAHLIDIDDLLLGQLAYPYVVVWLRLKEAFTDQFIDGAAHRRAAHAKLLGDDDLADPFAGLIPLGEDVLLDDVVHLIFDGQGNFLSARGHAHKLHHSPREYKLKEDANQSRECLFIRLKAL